MSFTPTRKRTIFVDLDNVLVDFISEYCRRFNQPKSIFVAGEFAGGNVEFWKMFETNPLGFFRDAPPFGGSRAFIEEIFTLADRYVYGVEALTALPKRTRVPSAEREKNEWVLAQKYSRHLPVKIGPYAVDKQSHYKPGDVLIDDNKLNIEQWIAKGGSGILHTNFEDSMEELKKILIGQSAGTQRLYDRSALPPVYSNAKEIVNDAN